MDAIETPVVKIGGGYLKAILLQGAVFGHDEKELVGQLKRRTDGLRVQAQRIELAMATRE